MKIKPTNDMKFDSGLKSYPEMVQKYKFKLQMIEDCSFNSNLTDASNSEERSCLVPHKSLYILCMCAIGLCNSLLYDNFLVIIT